MTLSNASAIQFWDTQSGERVREMPGHTGQVCAIVSVPGGGWITAADDCTIRRWDAAGKEVGRFEGHKREVTSLAISADGKTLFSGSLDGTVRAWDVAKRTELRQNDNGPFPKESLGGVLCLPEVGGLALSPDGKSLAVIGYHYRNSIRFYDATTLKLTGFVKVDNTPSIAFYNVAFLTEDRVAVRLSGGVRAWDIASGTEVIHIGASSHLLNLSAGLSTALAASPDRKQFVVQLSRKPNDRQKYVDLGICDTDKGTVLDRIEIDPKDAGSLKSAAYLPDGKAVAVGDSAGRVWIVDLEKKVVRKKFEGHRGPVLCLAVSADGKTVASGSADTTVLVWDLAKP